jgi:FkbM family methyltransferase
MAIARIRSRLRQDRTPAPAPEADPDRVRGSREALDNRSLELLLGWMLQEDSNCVDAGANQGRFLHEMVRRAPRGRHFAWEPIPELADHLRATYPDVDVHCAALSDEAGESSFVVAIDDMGYSGLRERQYPGDFQTRRIPVQVERLDDVLPADYALHFLKVDVEGNELGVFKGGLETIARNKPVIVFEHGIGAADRYGTTPEAVHDLLCGEAGLRIFDLDAAGPLSRDHFGEMFRSGSRWNYVALP